MYSKKIFRGLQSQEFFSKKIDFFLDLKNSGIVFVNYF